MRRLSVVAGAALVVGLMMSPAWGKGPVKATLKGPGLDKPVTFRGGERAGSDVMALAEHSGLFSALFESPSPMEDHRPTKELGPRYLVDYTIPSAPGDSVTVIQYIYPYASGGPVTHTPANQRFFEDQGDNGASLHTYGGWYQATSVLKSTLVSAGLPSSPPRSATESAAGTSASAAVWVAAGGLVVLSVGLGLVAIRRRGRLSTQQGAA